MGLVVADTHAILWFMESDPRLGQAAASALRAAEQILVPSISLVEIIYLVEKGRLFPEVLPRLVAELSNPSSTLRLTSLDQDIALAMRSIPRTVVPDLPDRVVAATALQFRAAPGDS